MGGARGPPHHDSKCQGCRMVLGLAGKGSPGSGVLLGSGRCSVSVCAMNEWDVMGHAREEGPGCTSLHHRICRLPCPPLPPPRDPRPGPHLRPLQLELDPWPG